jgi:hypothetical protein
MYDVANSVGLALQLLQALGVAMMFVVPIALAIRKLKGS